ncbi:transforming growth factor-beta-induced protein ig-h3-like isoform X1 [Haliotis rufescens]|uniref:transforming growth factor-beta-induced protein ig-h3-like isoform X2 n=1 Tax=Haliotis rufescens TaxID=6454 RepID=UPI00201E76DF|nr:transforming growth factor-beta-induced protein ig-h3-like isoform X2 [Haliotis rufescens]XP_048243798.1 transforming growth factor-beta-induced protein ig-h3-like isoform X1 [Haliotis rufescens]
MYALLVLCMLVVAATAQSTTVPTSNIIDFLTAGRQTTLLNLIQQAGLTDTLKGPGPFTLFVPDERSIRNLDATDTAKLTTFLKYHVVNGQYRLADLYNEESLTSLEPNQMIRVNYYNDAGEFTLEGKALQSSDHVLSNGIVHFISGMMIPPAGTVLDVVLKDGNLTTLASTIKSAMLENFFQDQKPITLFAPTDEAFNKLGSATVQGLIADPALLKSVLQYHVVPGTIYRAEYHSAYLHTFEEADRIRLHRFLFFGYEADDGGMVDDEVSATNGVVQKIDAVLIPSSLSDQVKALTAGATTAA